MLLKKFVVQIMKATYARLFLRRVIEFWAAAAVFTLANSSPALTISSGPSFSTAPNAPLGGRLQLTTDEYSRLSVSVNDGTTTWDRNFYDYDTSHSVPLLGFKPGRTNVITVTVYDRYGNEATGAQPLVFITDPLPRDFPKIAVLKSEPDKMEPGYTLFRVALNANRLSYLTVMDNSGQVVWYSGITTTVDVRQLDNGDLFVPLTTRFAEINMLGDTVHSWVVPTTLPINIHDGVPTDHGTILYLSTATRVVTNFPSSTTVSNAPRHTASISYEKVVEISATNAALLNVWSPIDMLDPTRITYLTFHFGTSWDSEHANAIIEDQRDNSLIISMRHQNAVIKFSRATGQLEWILGPPANWGPEWQKYLLTPVGTPFEWQYGQHSPIITPQGTLMLYDDGNFRASPFDPGVPDANNYSRAVEYDIDQKNMKITQVWDYGRTNAGRLYTDKVGNAEPLPKTRNVLIDFGSVKYVNGTPPSPYGPNATIARIQEVTYGSNPQVVFDVALSEYDNLLTSFRDCFVYRSHRIPDLYPVLTPTRAVADLIRALHDLDLPSGRSLIASLGDAVTAIGERNPDAAIDRLRTFQFLTSVTPVAPDMATQFVYEAQGIIDALSAGKASYATERFTGEFPVFSPTHAVADLIDAVGDSDIHLDRALIASLSTALVSIGENDADAAVRQLQTFQLLVQVARPDAGLADQFNNQAQRIIDAMSQGPGPGHRHLKMNFKGGRPCLDFSGDETNTYSVEASTDLVHWINIGAARPTGGGNFEFEDHNSDKFPTRYYRVVTP
jgi:arylsulfate sulfotransferase